MNSLGRCIALVLSGVGVALAPRVASTMESADPATDSRIDEVERRVTNLEARPHRPIDWETLAGLIGAAIVSASISTKRVGSGQPAPTSPGFFVPHPSWSPWSPVPGAPPLPPSESPRQPGSTANGPA